MGQNIRILQLVNGFAVGGAELKLLELCHHIQERHGSRLHQVICSVGLSGPLRQRFETLGLRTEVFKKRHAFDFSQVMGVARLMREEKIDLVQTTLFYADIIGALAARIAGVPIQISWETVSHRDNVFHNKIQRRLGYRFAMKYTDKIVAVSEECRQSIIHWRHVNPNRIAVIHYGVDLEQYRRDSKLNIRNALKLPKSAMVAGMVARLEPGKGHGILLKAFGKLDDAAHLVIVGDGTARSELEIQASRLGIQDRIHFLGVRKDVVQILNSVDLFVLPSFSEGLPNSILEAMACGLPIVATDVGGIPEVVYQNKNGILVDPGDVAGLKSALDFLFKCPDKRIRMGKASREIVERGFSLENQISQFVMLYERLYDGIAT